MRKLIYILSFLFTSFIFAQGGPKVDVIKFRGEVTSAIRDTFDVPTGETWLIWNVTTSQLEIAGSNDVWASASGGLVEGVNSVPTGVQFNQGTTNRIQLLSDLNGSPSIRLMAGVQDSTVYWVARNNQIDITFENGTDDYRFNNDGETDGIDIARKQYVDNAVSAGVLTVNEASEIQFTPYSTIASNTVQAAIQELLDESASGGDFWTTPVDSDIVPDTNEVYDLGSSSSYFLIGYINTLNTDIIFFNGGGVPDTDSGGAEGHLWYSFDDKKIKYNDNVNDYIALATESQLVPDNLYEVRASGAMDNTFAVSTGNEDKSLEIITNGTNRYYNPGASFTTLKNAKIKSSQVNDFAVIVPSSGYNMTGNGEAYFATNTATNTAPQGVYVDSLNPPVVIRNSPTANLFWAEGYYKLYNIGQVTGLASSNIAETSFDIDWDAATASVGTISDYQYSIDGGTPVDVTGATGATVSGLTASTTYNVNVRAVDAGGNVGQYSADLSVTTASSFTPLWTANAMTPTPNEVNGTGAFSGASGYSVTTGTTTTNGTHSIVLTRTVSDASSAEVIFQYQNLTIGQSYDFTYSIRVDNVTVPNNNYIIATGTYAADWTVTDFVEYGTGNVGNWETHTLTMTPAVTNPRIRFTSSAGVMVNVSGMTTTIDNHIVTAN